MASVEEKIKTTTGLVNGTQNTLLEEMKILKELQDESGSRKAISSELWHACAGPLVSLPQVGSLAYYFPQGHSEQVAVSTKRASTCGIPNYPNLPSQLMCQVHNVTLHADKETDDIYAQMTLQPVNSGSKMDRNPNDNVSCFYGELCTHKISRTKNNPGRIYVVCSKITGGCDFWQWLDETRVCQCRKGYCKLYTSKRKSSMNRRFYCCPFSKQGGSKGCSFWEWIDPPSKTPRKEVGSSSGKGNEVLEEAGLFSKPKGNEVKEEVEKKQLISVEEVRSWLLMTKEVTNVVVASMLSKLDLHK